MNADLRVRPFFAHGGKISIREFLVGAFNDEMGLQSVDPQMMPGLTRSETLCTAF